MSIVGVSSSVLADIYRHADRTQKIAAKKQAFAEMMQEMKKVPNASAQKETESSAEIVVKPDGSRVLSLTTGAGGMKTTMSIEISKPTDTCLTM